MKILRSTFSKFFNSISIQWLTALLAVFALAFIMPRVGKVWNDENAILWLVFLPMMLLRNTAKLVEIPAEQGMIVLLLLGTPLVVLYWCAAFWSVNKILRLVTGNHFGR